MSDSDATEVEITVELPSLESLREQRFADIYINTVDAAIRNDINALNELQNDPNYNPFEGTPHAPWHYAVENGSEDAMCHMLDWGHAHAYSVLRIFIVHALRNFSGDDLPGYIVEDANRLKEKVEGFGRGYECVPIQCICCGRWEVKFFWFGFISFFIAWCLPLFIYFSFTQKVALTINILSMIASVVLLFIMTYCTIYVRRIPEDNPYIF